MWRVAARMAKQMRTFTTYQAGPQDDADAMRKAGQGEFVGIKGDAEAVKTHQVPGIEKNAAGSIAMVDSTYNTTDDNLPLRAGLAPSSPTAAQDEQLGQASAGLAS